ncbi:MAG: hypothetical protein ACLSUW_04840 [Akkermansia sp.]
MPNIRQPNFPFHAQIFAMSITYLPGKEPHPRDAPHSENVNREGWNTSIDCYLADGGYEELKRRSAWSPGPSLTR